MAPKEERSVIVAFPSEFESGFFILLQSTASQQNEWGDPCSSLILRAECICSISAGLGGGYRHIGETRTIAKEEMKIHEQAHVPELCDAGCCARNLSLWAERDLLGSAHDCQPECLPACSMQPSPPR